MATAGAPLTFTATGTSTTCTVAGSLTRIQANRGTTATAYLATAGTRRYGLAIDYDPVTHVCNGLLVEPAATNMLLNSITLSTQSVTVTAVAHALSFFGTGTITLSGVSTAGPLVGTGANARVSLLFTPTAGSLTLTVSGTVTNAQLEVASTTAVATSPFPTWGVTQQRQADNYTFLLSTIPALGAEYSMYERCSVPNPSTNIRCTAAITDGTANEQSKFSITAGALRAIVVDGGTSVGIMAGQALVADTLASAAARFKLNDCAYSMNGTAVVADTAVTLPTVTEVRFANTGSNAAAQDVVTVAKLVIVPRAWSDVELVAKSAT